MEKINIQIRNDYDKRFEVYEKRMIGSFLNSMAKDIEFVSLSEACSGHNCSIKTTGVYCSVCKKTKI
jgi:hypothetical protein